MQNLKRHEPSKRLLFSCLFFLLLITEAPVNGVQLADATVSTHRSPPVHVCIVVRTYWGHGWYGSNSLEHLLRSLQAQNHSYWEVLLVVLDSMTFPDLPYLIQQLNDNRIWTFADLISLEFTARNNDGRWVEGYHKKLYDVTDEAIRACRQDTKWVVVTNGDNDYGQGFLDELLRMDESNAELVAFDFYSRYYNPTGIPCERFAHEEVRPPCKVKKWS